MTLLSANKPEFIHTLSLNLSQVTPDFVSRSEPAKSIKLILKDNLHLPTLLILSTKRVNIA